MKEKNALDSFSDKCRDICDLIYHSLRIPIYAFQQEALLYSPIAELFVVPPQRYIDQILAGKEPVFYTDYGTCYARIDADDDPKLHLILGPVTTLSLADRSLSQMYRDYAVPDSKQEDFRVFHLQIPTMTYLDFFYHLLTVFYMMNSRVIGLSDFIPAADKEDTIRSRQRQAEKMFVQKEENSYNNSIEIENTLLSIIRTGDIEAMEGFTKAAPSYNAGIIGNTPIRLHKNYFISTMALATRAAIDGGLSPEQALRFSDLYLSKAEDLNDLQSINILFVQALTDLTFQVYVQLQERLQLASDDGNRTVQICMDYIRKHTHSRMSVQSVSDALGYNRSYLSSAFTKATGIRLNDYIFFCKLEESRSLLRYTTKKISEISDTLCFANQSHFVQRFKKRYGMTPAKFRSSL